MFTNFHLPFIPPCLSAGPNKDDIRSQVWTLMEETNLVEFPRPCYQRIPNFRGARNACEKLLGLDCFRKAFTVKVNPDKPQEVARFLALQFNKKVGFHSIAYWDESLAFPVRWGEQF